MKRKIIALVLSFSCLFIGCKGGDDKTDKDAGKETKINDEQSEKDDEVDDLSVENQIKIIYDNADVWEITDDDIVYMDDTVSYGYTVVDLDKDGFIEVIKSVCQGKNQACTNTIYEVASGNELVEFDMSAFRSSSFEPNLMVNHTHIIDDTKYMVQGSEINSIGFTNDYYYIMSLENNSIELTELKDYNANVEYENTDIVKFCWFDEITEDNIKDSYDKRYVQS